MVGLWCSAAQISGRRGSTALPIAGGCGLTRARSLGLMAFVPQDGTNSFRRWASSLPFSRPHGLCLWQILFGISQMPQIPNGSSVADNPVSVLVKNSQANHGWAAFATVSQISDQPTAHPDCRDRRVRRAVDPLVRSSLALLAVHLWPRPLEANARCRLKQSDCSWCRARKFCSPPWFARFVPLQSSWGCFP